MTTKLNISSGEAARIRKEYADALARVQRYKNEHPGEPWPITRIKGILIGKVNWTDEDIEAAKIRPRNLPPD